MLPELDVFQLQVVASVVFVSLIGVMIRAETRVLLMALVASQLSPTYEVIIAVGCIAVLPRAIGIARSLV